MTSPAAATCYGPQHYRAAVIYQPQGERPAVAEFLAKAAATGRTAWFRVGEWTLDFDGRPFDAAAALPPGLKPVAAAEVVRQVIDCLKAAGIEPQTPCTPHGGGVFPASMMPKPSGQCRLLDGTRILASGEKEVTGDPIQQSLTIRGQTVTFDAVGVAAVRLDPAGRVEAMAGGGLRRFQAADLNIELPQPADLALWRDAAGQWHGVLQGWTGPVPAALRGITSDWLRVSVPVPLTN